MKYLLTTIFYVLISSWNVHSEELLLKNESPHEFSSEDDNLNDLEKDTENDKLITSELEEEEIIDKEISSEVGDREETEEVEIIEADNKYHLSGIAMPEKNQIRKGDIYYLKGAEDLKLDNIYFDIPVVYNKPTTH